MHFKDNFFSKLCHLRFLDDNYIHYRAEYILIKDNRNQKHSEDSGKFKTSYLLMNFAKFNLFHSEVKHFENIISNEGVIPSMRAPTFLTL